MIHNYCVSTMTHRYKYGVELPRSAKHALEIDKRNGNNKWADAIRTEIMQMIYEFKAFCVHDSEVPQKVIKNYAITLFLMSRPTVIVKLNG